MNRDDPKRFGHVAFVGAGPGQADLITVRGATRLGEADVVLLVVDVAVGVTDEDARAAEVVRRSGSPRPRDQSDAALGSWRTSSTLLATRKTGLSILRSIRTTCSSVAVAPTLASTTKRTASERSMATSA